MPPTTYTPCPRCDSPAGLHVRRVADVGHIGGAPCLHLLKEMAMVRNPGRFHEQQRGFISVGRLEAHVCNSCGLCELYTIGADMIPVDGDRVVAIGPDPG